MATATAVTGSGAATQGPRTKKKKSIMRSTLRGRWLPTEFFGRNWGYIMAATLLILIYITNRYQCITAMETIQRLESELEVVKSERIREKSYYMSNIRESAMRDRLQSAGLNLEIRKKPPYKLNLND